MTTTTTTWATALAEPVAPETATAEQPFRMLVAIVKHPTSDGRVFDTLTFREFPLTVWSQMSNLPGHEGALVAGRADFMVEQGDERWVYGMLDGVGDSGKETIRLIAGQFLRGVSVDASALTVEEDDDGLRHFDAEVGAITIVGFPAFRETQIDLIDQATYAAARAGLAEFERAAVIEATDYGHVTDMSVNVRTDPDFGVGIVASARPILPARAFTRAPMTTREGVHAEDDGRIWGHVYGWGECHVGSPPGRCIKPPPSKVDYAYFLTGDVPLDDGTEVPVGQIVISTDHAPLNLGWSQARDHYAHTGLVVADVTCGEDEYGIWIAGMIRPGCSPEVLHAFHAAKKISGDWRPVGIGLELVSILTVNVEGYPPLRTHLENDRVTALVASTPMDGHGDCGCGGGVPGLSELHARLNAIDADLAEYRAVKAAERDEVIAAMELDLGLDPETVIAQMATELGV